MRLTKFGHSCLLVEEGGALWRDYLTSVLSKPIIRQEIEHEIQTAA